MNRFFRWTLKHKALIIAVYTIGCILCALSQPQVQVNYDMNDYLPEDSPSTIALNVMEDEFEGGIPNARVMISKVSLPEALAYKQKLLDISGITDVIWLDDAVSIYEPLEMQDSDTIESYYKDGNALFTVTVDEEKRVEAVNAIRGLIGGNNAMTGAAVNMAVATESTVKEIRKIVKIAIPIVFVILLLTTTSWFEPVLFLASIGIAVLLNSGSNLMFGTISFVTNGAGNILQLAVSLDYSVFLLHRFEEFRGEGLEAEEAMVQALCGSFTSILSSGLTTVIGFAALILMRFGIGPDMGMALAKGVCFSLLVVFTILPVMVMLTYKWVEKTAHPSLMPKFVLFGKAVSKQMIPMVIIFCMVILPSYRAQNYNSFYYGSEHIFDSSTQLGQDTEKIDGVFGKSSPMVLLVPRGDTAKQTLLSNALKAIPEVSSVVSFVDSAGAEIPQEYLDKDILSKLESEHYSRMVLTVDTEYEGSDAFNTVRKIRKISGDYYPGEWQLAGESVSTYDLMDTITADNLTVNLIAIGAVFAVLLFSFRSLLIPFILVLAIETAIWINLSVPFFTDSTLFYLAYLIISSIQLGATVDYAILTTSRYLEFRAALPRKKAIQETISVVTVSILTSGSVMTLVGFLLGSITSHGVLKQLGLLLGSGTLMSMTIVFFVLPGLLYLLDTPIEKTTKGITFYREIKTANLKLTERV
ncbi:MAG: MMPL family transporter [Clostridiaceae bacterium]|nr:MMPL family transporter [Clostridiaceae bacterium]